ncbi:hypothetical protein LOK49_LG03G03325 [Camellia lanceoleosa]|uniref:Uncharacterized protein n=1 Tax=Camellia lanceoleosa TaxID=1840588 RepID=A0ACC0IAD4_9ERIC|nr:hypothetical protein LOK49_LG03G03325 [Camellia lanceoleosa]
MISFVRFIECLCTSDDGYIKEACKHSFVFSCLICLSSENKLPLKYKDLLSFCFPGGVEITILVAAEGLHELPTINGSGDLKEASQKLSMAVEKMM